MPPGLSLQSVWSESGLLFDQRSFERRFPDKLVGLGAQPGDDAAFSAVLVAAIECRVREGLLRLKSFLKLAYGFSDERLVQFSPHDKVATTADKVRLADHVTPFSMLPAAAQYAKQLPLSMSLKEETGVGIVSPAVQEPATAYVLLRAAVADCNRLVAILDADPEDLTVSGGGKGGKGKKRAAAAALDAVGADSDGGGGGKGGKRGRKAAAPAKAKAKPKPKGKKRRKMATPSSSEDEDSDEEDDGDDDEDYR